MRFIEVKQLGQIDGTDGIDVDLTTVNEHNEANRLTIYHRNLLGQVEGMTDGLGHKETYRYSPKGELLEKVDKEGYLTTYSYTPQGDVNEIQYADGKAVKMRYNPLRQLTEIKDWLGTTSMTLDPLGRATQVKDHHDQTVAYQYGAAGQRTGITYPDGREVTYAYDANLRLTQVTDGTNPVDYRYDPLGRLIEKSFANGTRTAYNFNALGQLSELTHFKQNEVLDKYVYGYDRLGNKTVINKQRQGLDLDSGIFEYRYDSLNRLTEVTKDGQALRSYGYDAFGNRAKMVENGVETTYHFNALNQLISSSDDKSYAYDKRGNLTEIMKNGQLTHAYEFNPLNRLEKAINHQTGQSSIYQYNGLGHRTGQTIGDMDLNPMKQIDDVLDLTKAYSNLLCRNEDGKVTQFTYDFGILGSTSNDMSESYLLDELGSPVRFGDEAYLFDEFGNGLHETSSQPFGFTGYTNDPISGLALSPSRAYSPELGRFTSADPYWNPSNMIYGDDSNNIVPDPLAIAQSNNLYSYTVNNPLGYVDPLGEDAWWIIDGLRWPGEIHSLVSLRIRANNPSLTGERWMNTPTGPGRVDLVDRSTGAIFEIKPENWPSATAQLQLRNYTQGTFLNPELHYLHQRLHVGNGIGYNFNGSFVTPPRVVGNFIVTHNVRYWYEGNGIINYSYTTQRLFKPQPVPVPEREPVRVQEPERRGFRWDYVIGGGLVIVGGIGVIASIAGTPFTFGGSALGIGPSGSLVAAGLAIFFMPNDALEFGTEGCQVG